MHAKIASGVYPSPPPGVLSGLVGDVTSGRARAVAFCCETHGEGNDALANYKRDPADGMGSVRSALGVLGASPGGADTVHA